MVRKHCMSDVEFETWFFETLDKRPDGCWEWKGCKTKRGYGQLTRNKKVIFTHRYSLEAKLGRPIETGFVTCHSCNFRACCNPDHLREGTPSENTRDMYRSGREARGDKVRQPGEKHGMSKLKDAEVREIRALRGTKTGIDIANQFSVSTSVISSIQLGKTWKHID